MKKVPKYKDPLYTTMDTKTSNEDTAMTDNKKAGVFSIENEGKSERKMSRKLKSILKYINVQLTKQCYKAE